MNNFEREINIHMYAVYHMYTVYMYVFLVFMERFLIMTLYDQNTSCVMSE